MARPTSFRLPEDLLDELDQEASASGASVTSLVTALLGEGIKARHFPGLIYRDGPTGRRAGLVGGPDVWEVVRAIQGASGRGEQRLRSVAEERDLTLGQVRLAVDFYGTYPDEVDQRIEADEREAQRVRKIIERRERLLSS